MGERSPAGEREIIDGFLAGETYSVRIVDGWIDTVLHGEFAGLREDWDDLRQEVRTRVFRNLSRSRFDGRSMLRTYVHRIARNAGIDAARRTHRRREEPFSARGGHSDAADQLSGEGGLIARDLLARILEGLPEGDRLLLHLVFAEHLSYAEAAGRLGISEDAVKVRMFRCRDRLLRLREILKPRRKDS